MSYDKKNKNEDVLSEAKERFALCLEAYSDLYKKGEEDVRFLYGIKQWDQKQEEARRKANRPCLTFNQLPPYFHQLVNDFRQSRPAIRVSPVDDKADVETAEIIQGLIRNTERQSKADQAYDTAFANAVSAGIGWIRIGTEYAHDMSFEQEPVIYRVLNFQSCYIDPAANELDGSDAEWGFAFDDVLIEAFKEQYPDAGIVDFEDGDWKTENKIRVAEYWCKQYRDETIYKIRITVMGDNKDAVVTKPELDLLDDEGVIYEILEERETRFPYVRYCKLTGAEILEEDDWVGDYIPLVPVYGEEYWLDGERKFESFLRQAKDAQRAYNYWKTADTEFTALQQKAPYIGPVGSFSSYPSEWQNANNDNYAYLEYDIVYDDNNQRVEHPQKQPPIQGSPTMMNSALQARDDIRLAIGMPNANMGQQGNEVSGIAIRNRQIEGDNANFHFTGNMAASMSRVGVILLNLYRKLYSDRKITRILGEDGKTELQVPLNTPYVKQGKSYKAAKGQPADGVFDLNTGRYDVVMDVGASYSSKRQETSDKLSELMGIRPELVGVVGDIAVEALDIPMAKEIAKRLRSQMPPELLGEDDPNVERLKLAQLEIQKAEELIKNLQAALADKEKNKEQELILERMKIELDRIKTETEAAKTQAETAEIYNEIGSEEIKGAVKDIGMAVSSVMDQVKDVSETLNIILDAKQAEMMAATSEPESDEQLMESEENE